VNHGTQHLLAGIDRTRQTLLAAVDQLYSTLIGAAHADVANGQLYYVHADHLGTPKALTNEAGNLVWSATHDPFGMATVAAGSVVEMNLRFPGQYYDAETGLHYNYFRTYDPGTGRYLESDPIGLKGGLNTYAYVSGNPLTKIDPQGLVECGWWNDNCSRGDPPNSPPTCVTPECAAGLPPITTV